MPLGRSWECSEPLRWGSRPDHLAGAAIGCLFAALESSHAIEPLRDAEEETVGRQRLGLWPMEGTWSSSVKDVRSIEPLLDVVRANKIAVSLERPLRINDRDDVITHMKRWGQRQHDRYNIGYLGLHGEAHTVLAGRQRLSLFDAAEQLSDVDLSGKILHVGSCEVLKDPEDRPALRKALGVKVLSGFTKQVGWVESLAYELLYLDALAGYAHPGGAFRFLKSTYRDFTKHVGFVMVTASRS